MPAVPTISITLCHTVLIRLSQVLKFLTTRFLNSLTEEKILDHSLKLIFNTNYDVTFQLCVDIRSKHIFFNFAALDNQSASMREVGNNKSSVNCKIPAIWLVVDRMSIHKKCPLQGPGSNAFKILWFLLNYDRYLLRD